MADEFGAPEPGNAEDYQQFMLALYDLLADGRDLEAREDALSLIAQARLLLIDEFEAKHPGYGKGRAVWR